MKLTPRSRFQLRSQKAVFLLLFLCTIGMLAWLSDHYNQQFDLTANQRHSLSSDSIDLLRRLDKPVTVHAYTLDEVTRQAIREIISRYQNIKPDFNLRLLNPDIDITQAQQDGIVMNKPFAFVIYYNGRMEHIDSLSEQAISNALLRLNRRDNQLVVFLKGHGERDIDGTDTRAYSDLAGQLREMGFNLRSVNLIENKLPAQTKILVIAAPDKPYLDGEVEQIQHYIDDGGNLLWLSDPGHTDELKLRPLATAFGLQLQDGIIVDNNTDLRRTLNIQHPAIIPVTEYFPHIVTNTIRYNTLFPMARGISPLTNDSTVNHWQLTPLFGSLPRSWTETDGLSEEMTFNTGSGDVAGPITIAVAIQRERSGSSQRGIIVGDSDFISDTYIGAGANLNLALNMFNWLIGDDDLISVEIKPSPDTRLVLSDTEILIISISFLLLIPLALLAFGFRLWHVRRRR